MTNVIEYVLCDIIMETESRNVENDISSKNFSYDKCNCKYCICCFIKQMHKDLSNL